MASPSEDKAREFSKLLEISRVFAEFGDREFPIGSISRVENLKNWANPAKPTSRWLSGLREGINDELEMAADFDSETFRRLDSELQDKCNVSLDSLMSKRLTKISAIVSRGKIATDAQFRMLLGRLDQIHSKAGMEQEAAALQTLLLDYEQKATKKRKKDRM
ncbi:MAG: hypothetical protein QM719_06035 [Thermomonas sp.]